MLGSLGRNSIVKEYLSLYPKSQWPKCLKYTLIVGIHSIQLHTADFLTTADLKALSKGPALPLSVQIPQIKSKLQTLKRDIKKLNDSKIPRSASVPHKHFKPKKTQRPPEINTETEKSVTPKFKAIERIANANKDSFPRTTTAVPYTVRENSPTLEELLSNSREVPFRAKHRPLKSRMVRENPNTEDGSGILLIADEFLRNPLICQLSKQTRSHRYFNKPLTKL